MKAFFALALAAVLCAEGHGAAELLIRNGDRVAFLGDSITEFGNRPHGYVRLVMDGLKRSGINAVCIPAGVSGNRSVQMLNRLPNVLKKKPTWLLLSCGVNDVWHGAAGVPLPAYKKNMKEILDRCRDAGVKVMILTPTMIGENPANRNNGKLKDYCEFLREEAAARKLPLADLNARMHTELKKFTLDKMKSKLTVDGVHMNGYGNEMMAAGILSAMGVPEAQIQSFQREWRKMPSMFPFYRSMQCGISINDYEKLYAEAVRKNVDLDVLLRQVLQDYIKTLK